MKVLGINATYLSPGKWTRPRREEPIYKTQRLLDRIPNLKLCTSYSEGISELNLNKTYDTIVTSFTPFDIISPNDRKVFSTGIDVEEYKAIGWGSYYSAFYYLDLLMNMNPDAHFIIYSGAYSGDRKPDPIITNRFNGKVKTYDWINKNGDRDKYKIEKSIIDSKIEIELSISPDNKIVILPKVKRGPVDYKFEDNLSAISVPSFVNKKFILNDEILEFQELINKENVTEHQIQIFLERFPNFLLGSKYKSIKSQVHLKRYSQGDLIPDFILEPINKNDFWKIVDIKLPQKKIVKKTKNREGFNSQIMDALNQLNNYRNYFDNPDYRKKMQAIGIDAYKPDLSVIIGKDYGPLSYEEIIAAKTSFKSHSFEIFTFTDLINHASHLNKIM